MTVCAVLYEGEHFTCGFSCFTVLPGRSLPGLVHSAGLDRALVKGLVQMLGHQLYRGLHPYSTDSILQLQLQVHLLVLAVGG